MSTAAHPHSTVTWCHTRNGYADVEFCDSGDPHTDVVIDEAGKVLYPMHPVGTAYLAPDGSIYALRRYDNDLWVDPEVIEKIIPCYDRFSERGASTIRGHEALPAGSVRIVYPHAVPVLPGSLYVRPNGEAWRCRGYRTDYKAWSATNDWTGPPTQVPDWSIAHVSGSQSSGGHQTLPVDARLVWAP